MIVVIELGMVVLTREEHREKAHSPMVVMELGSSIERRDEQSSKANSSIIVTEPGIERLARDDRASLKGGKSNRGYRGRNDGSTSY